MYDYGIYDCRIGIQNIICYTKIKLQLFISDIFVQKIKRNTEFWSEKMESPLIDFYKKHLLDEIVNPKILYN